MTPNSRTALRFHRFRFDPVHLRLTLGQAPVTLRPKAASLLALLLARRGTVVSKREIGERLWGGGHVSDQSLFQVVSELRRALAPLEAVVTHPNLGYRWVAPVRVERPRVRAVAAALALLASGVAAQLALAPADSAGVAHSSQLPLPPAVDAFQTGLRHLAADDPVEAETWFRLALRENPRFDEARLMAAEALLAQGRAGAARELAATLLPQADLLGDDSLSAVPAGSGSMSGGGAASGYNAVAAMAFLGRSELLAGRDAAGLRWSQAAAGQAREAGYLCVAAQIEDRIAAVLSGARAAQVDRLPADRAGSAAAPSPAARIEPTRSVALDPSPEHCRQIGAPSLRDALPGQSGECLGGPARPARERRRWA